MGKYSDSNQGSRRTYHGHYPATPQKDSDGKHYCYYNSLLPMEQVEAMPFNTFQYFSRSLVEDQNNCLPKAAQTVEFLTRLADEMVDRAGVADSNSTIPPGYTYWGQFIDHDLTAGTNIAGGNVITQDMFDPMIPSQVEQDITNTRTPFFDLDSVFGDSNGPFGFNTSFYGHAGDPVKLRIGTVTNAPAEETPRPELGLERDLLRNADKIRPNDAVTIAVIGDERNDENLIVAQFHLGIMKFYNEVVDVFRAANPNSTLLQIYRQARREVTLHYQWLVVNDFLMCICNPAVVNYALKSESIFSNGVYMPLEFATAVYRFGHTMVRNQYDFNRNFPTAGFDLLFGFTGKGGRFTKNLPNNWIIEWDRFFSNDASFPERFARKLDTRLATALTVDGMQNELVTKVEGDPPRVSVTQFNAIMAHLARRNLRRGYLLAMPTGQALADFFGITPLTPADLLSGNSEAVNDILCQSGFDEKTPLWYYVLKEAEVQQDGNRLGELGSFVVAKTFIGLMMSDQDSYLNVEDGPWHPSNSGLSSVDGEPIHTIMALLKFAKVA